MRVLVTGAYGFIGRTLVTALQQYGHEVIAVVKDLKQAKRLLPPLTFIQGDFNQDTEAAIWETRLQGVDAVINCVGVLQPHGKQSIQAIHNKAPIALFTACEKVGVKKIIQISAQGADALAITEYGQSKYAADQFLQNIPVNWVILRPSLVYGPGSYGGSSLFRGLCGLPGVLPIVGNGDQVFQPLHIDDLVLAIIKLLESSAVLCITLDAVGSEQVTLRQLLIQLRQWLGFGPAKVIHIPVGIMLLLVQLFYFCFRGPVSFTSIKMLQASAAVDPQPFAKTIGFIPRGWRTGLARMVSHVQDRWHARLYFLSPLLKIGIAGVWILSGLIPLLGIPLANNTAWLIEMGFSYALASPIFYGLVILDIGLGLATLFNWHLRWVVIIEILVIIVYTLVMTITLPKIWLEPFGALIKNIPLLLATWVMWILQEQR